MIESLGDDGRDGCLSVMVLTVVVIVRIIRVVIAFVASGCHGARSQGTNRALARRRVGVLHASITRIVSG